jgi:hypothetical protein
MPRKNNAAQLSLFEKQQRWNDLPHETRRQVVQDLASLLAAQQERPCKPAAEPEPYPSSQANKELTRV